MNNKNISLNILGCCVLRDTFGMHKDNGGYEINQYVQIPSPISLVTKSPLYNIDEEFDDTIFCDKSAFLKRCQVLELKKQVFDYMGEKNSDYLIIDCAEFRKNMLYFPMTDGYFTESHKDLLPRYIDRKYIPAEYEVVDPLKIDKEILHRYLNDFCDSVLSLYDREHIILFEIKAVEIHTDGKTIYTFSGKHELAKRYNERMKTCFDYVRSRLNGCHIVAFPNGVIGDTNHKWGKGLLHYVPEYYDYSKKAVDVITQNLSGRKDEERALEFLKHNYEKLFQDKYMEVFRCSLEVNERKKQEAEKILKYERFFKKILIKDYKKQIKLFLEAEGIKSCALYGKTQITDVFIVWFREWKIDIDYIVENWFKSPVYKEIPLIKRDDINLLNCKNMIICDVADGDVKKKLTRLGFGGKVLSYNELIE